MITFEKMVGGDIYLAVIHTGNDQLPDFNVYISGADFPLSVDDIDYVKAAFGNQYDREAMNYLNRNFTWGGWTRSNFKGITVYKVQFGIVPDSFNNAGYSQSTVVFNYGEDYGGAD